MTSRSRKNADIDEKILKSSVDSGIRQVVAIHPCNQGRLKRCYVGESTLSILKNLAEQK